MDIIAARETLENHKDEPLDKLGEAIEVLKEEYGTHEGIAAQVGPSQATISKYYRLSKLPEGIRWKVEEGELSGEAAVKICRLKEENDQWVLAFAIVDAANDVLTTRECKEVVEDVRETGRPVEEVLTYRFGFDFDKTVSLLLPIRYWFRFKICRAAWNRQQEWKNLAYEILRQWLDGREFLSTADLHEISQELIDAANRLEDLAE